MKSQLPGGWAASCRYKVMDRPEKSFSLGLHPEPLPPPPHREVTEHGGLVRPTVGTGQVDRGTVEMGPRVLQEEL